MSNSDTKYGLVWTQHGNFIDGEPIIIFRARDTALPRLLRRYRLLCKYLGSPIHHLEAIDKTISRIETWQKENPSEVVVPRSDAYAKRIGKIP